MGKQKPRSVHYIKTEATGMETIGRMACGKYGPRAFVHVPETDQPNDVTCLACIDEMKKSMWHCDRCGFLENEQVTFEECCQVCGRAIIL